MFACCVAECVNLLAVSSILKLFFQYTLFVGYGAMVAAMVSLMAFGSGGDLSQSDSLLTHVLGEIIVSRPCICLESGCDVWTLFSATHSFSHDNI